VAEFAAQVPVYNLSRRLRLEELNATIERIVAGV
jgi:hypothetical protein